MLPWQLFDVVRCIIYTSSKLLLLNHSIYTMSDTVIHHCIPPASVQKFMWIYSRAYIPTNHGLYKTSHDLINNRIVDDLYTCT